MNDEECLELIQISAKLFSNAGVEWRKARVGILGFWVGSEGSSCSSQKQRAEESEMRWEAQNISFTNPYSPIVEFLSMGGSFGRWEHHVLDIHCPSGEKFGVSEASFEKL